MIAPRAQLGRDIRQCSWPGPWSGARERQRRVSEILFLRPVPVMTSRKAHVVHGGCEALHSVGSPPASIVSSAVSADRTGHRLTYARCKTRLSSHGSPRTSSLRLSSQSTMQIGHVSRLIDSGSESTAEVACTVKPEDLSWGCAGGTSATVALGLNHRHCQLWGRTESFSAPASATIAAGLGHGPADVETSFRTSCISSGTVAYLRASGSWSVASARGVALYTRSAGTYTCEHASS